MMKYIILTAIIIAAMLYIGDFKLSLSPFSISMPGWKLAVGWLFLWLAYLLWFGHWYGKGYERGLKRGAEITIEQVQKIIKEKDGDEK